MNVTRRLDGGDRVLRIAAQIKTDAQYYALRIKEKWPFLAPKVAHVVVSEIKVLDCDENHLPRLSGKIPQLVSE